VIGKYGPYRPEHVGPEGKKVVKNEARKDSVKLGKMYFFLYKQQPRVTIPARY
jgi:hypothetical protein